MKVWFTLLLTTLFWAATFHVGKYTVGIMAPLAIAIWRFAIASGALLPWVARNEGINWRGIGANLLPLLVMGGVGVLGFNLGLFYGLQSTSPVNAALIMALNPAVTTVLASLLGRERIRPLRWLGLALGIAGVATVVTRGSWHVLRNLSFGHGDVLLLGACVAWAVYSVIPKRYVRDLSPLQITLSSITIGVIAMLIFAVCVVHQPLHLPPAAAVLPLLFMGLLASALAYIWWNEGIVKFGAARTAMFMNLVPVLTAAIGVALGQTLVMAQIVGALLVIGGVMIAGRG